MPTSSVENELKGLFFSSLFTEFNLKTYKQCSSKDYLIAHLFTIRGGIANEILNYMRQHDQTYQNTELFNVT